MSNKWFDFFSPNTKKMFKSTDNTFDLLMAKARRVFKKMFFKSLAKIITYPLYFFIIAITNKDKSQTFKCFLVLCQ